MKAECFKGLSLKVNSLREDIDKSLFDKIGDDFANWVLVFVTQEEDQSVLDLLSSIYTTDGWDIKIKSECDDYHDVRYVNNIYLRYRCDE
jgi:hypothetical protein